MELCLLGCRDDIIHAKLPLVIPIANVLCNAAVKQNWLLGNDPDLGAQEWNVDLSGIMSVDSLDNNSGGKKKTQTCHFLSTPSQVSNKMRNAITNKEHKGCYVCSPLVLGQGRKISQAAGR